MPIRLSKFGEYFPPMLGAYVTFWTSVFGKKGTLCSRPFEKTAFYLLKKFSGFSFVFRAVVLLNSMRIDVYFSSNRWLAEMR